MENFTVEDLRKARELLKLHSREVLDGMLAFEAPAEPRPRIKKNSVACLKCGEIIESRTRHEFVWCSCHGIAVDGGKDYLKRCGDLDGYKELSEYEPSQS